MTAPDLIPVTELPAIFHRSRLTIHRWIKAGLLRTVRVGPAEYVRRDDVEAMLTPARSVRAQLAAAREAGQPILSPEQLSLVRRVMLDALDSLAVKQPRGE